MRKSSKNKKQFPDDEWGIIRGRTSKRATTKTRKLTLTLYRKADFSEEAVFVGFDFERWAAFGPAPSCSQCYGGLNKVCDRSAHQGFAADSFDIYWLCCGSVLIPWLW